LRGGLSPKYFKKNKGARATLFRKWGGPYCFFFGDYSVPFPFNKKDEKKNPKKKKGLMPQKKKPYKKKGAPLF